MLRRAVAVAPDHPVALHDWAVSLSLHGERDEAVATLRQLLAIHPTLRASRGLLACLLIESDAAQEALTVLEPVLATCPDESWIRLLQARALHVLGQDAAAHAAVHAAIAADPGAPEPRWMRVVLSVPALPALGPDPDLVATALTASVRDFIAWAETHPDAWRTLAAPELPEVPGATSTALASDYGALASRLMRRWEVGSGLTEATDQPRSTVSADGRIRVGIVSGHVRNCSVWRFLLRAWVASLPPERFVLTLFHTGRAVDAETEWARGRAAASVHGPLDLREWVRRIRDSAPDILLYPDVTADPAAARLARMRLAPVQATSWACATRLRGPTIDHILEPEPGMGLACEPPPTAFVPPDLAASGIAGDAPILLSAAPLDFYAPCDVKALRAIAHRMTGGAIIMTADRTHASRVERLAAALRDGMTGGARIVVLPAQGPTGFRGLLRRAAVLLDPMGKSDVFAGLRALGVATPVLTMHADGVLAHALRRAGLDRLVVPDTSAYVDLATRLATNPAWRETLFGPLQAARGVVFSDRSAAEALANRLGTLHANARRPPASPEIEQPVALLLTHGPAAQALAALDHVASQFPDEPRVLLPRGEALNRLGRQAEAMACYDRALAVAPPTPEVLNNRANLLAASGQMQAAQDAFAAATELFPGSSLLHLNHGNVLQAMDQNEAAVAAFDRALALAPGDPGALNNRGLSLRRLGRGDAALASFEAAIAAAPDFVPALANLATEREERGDTEIARALYRQILTLAPDDLRGRCGLVSTWLPLIRPAGHDLDAARAGFAGALRDLFAWARGADRPQDVAPEVYPFVLAYHDRDNRVLLETQGRMAAELMEIWRAREGIAADLPTARPERIRLGIVSAQIHDHSVWHALVKGWIRDLDRSGFELHLFHTGRRRDAETDWARERSDSFTSGLRGLGDWVRAVQARQPDVLIYPELGMDKLTMQLAALRLARVQMAAWGHPETTGLPTIDAYLSAEALEPVGSSIHYSEQLIALPRLGCSYVPPEIITDRADPLADLGLDGEGPLFVSAGTPFKYAPEDDHVFVEIARRLGRCRFAFFEFPRVPALSALVWHRLEAAFAASGLTFADHALRLPWLSRSAFHALLRRADGMLDTIGFSGFNTTMQALACNLPIVTLEGAFLRGRLAAGVLRTAGLEDLVVTDRRAYVERAVRLATDPNWRLELAARIAARRQFLCHDTGTVRALETALRTAVAAAA